MNTDPTPPLCSGTLGPETGPECPSRTVSPRPSPSLSPALARAAARSRCSQFSVASTPPSCHLPAKRLLLVPVSSHLPRRSVTCPAGPGPCPAVRSSLPPSVPSPCPVCDARTCCGPLPLSSPPPPPQRSVRRRCRWVGPEKRRRFVSHSLSSAGCAVGRGGETALLMTNCGENLNKYVIPSVEI